MSDEIERELIEAMQGDREAIQRVAQRLNGTASAGQGEFVVTQEQFDAAVKHRAQGLAEKHRFEAHYPDVVEDDEQYAAALKLDTEMANRYPNMTERERFDAVGETVRRGFGADMDRAQAIAAEKARHRRAQQEAGSDEASHAPSAADIAIAESEADHQSHIAEGIAAAVRSRGPRVAPQRTEEQKLRDERIALERRRKAAGW